MSKWKKIKPIIGIIIIIILGYNFVKWLMPREGSTPEEIANRAVTQAVSPTGLDNIKAASAGNGYTLAVDAQGRLWAWGKNDYGRLGTGNTRLRRLPIQIMEDTAFVSAATGGEHSLALDTSGNLWAWGRGRYGQNGALNSNPSKPKMMKLENVVSISAGNNHSVAITSDGGLWAWGYNNSNQLGDGSRISTGAPTHIMDGVTAVSAGYNHTAVLKNDGSVWAWGLYADDYAKEESMPERTASAKINIDGVTMISAGDRYTLALKSDGSVWNCGRYAPVHVMDNAVYIAAGTTHNFAIDRSGNLWAWGENKNGQLGDGTTETRDAPVMVMSGVASVFAGIDHTIAVKTDGSVLAWGRNTDGELGIAVEDVREGGFNQVLGDIWAWLWNICQSSLFVLQVVYGLLAMVLPEFMIFSGNHALWHNIIIGVVLVGGYLALAIMYLHYAIIGIKSLKSSGDEACGFSIYPVWHWILYAAAALVIPLVGYFELSGGVLYILMAALIAIPQLYLLIRGKAHYPRLLLSQLAAVAFLVLGFFIFTVAAFIIGTIILISIGGYAMGQGMKEGRYRCPNCGRSVSTYGSTCPYCQ